jgi:small-conductance mechanosensitive channel
MFLLHFLPDWLLSGFVNTVLVAGAALTVISYFTTWIPFVTQYRVPAQVVGLILLTAGVYFKGGESAESQWRARVAEQQQKIARAEALSQQANQQLQQELKNSKQLTEKVKDAAKQTIQANAQQIDRECRVPDVAIQLHNSSSRNEIPRSAPGTAGALPRTVPGTGK